MKVIHNDLIPIKGFTALSIGPLIFARKDCKLYDSTIRHETIHWEQQKELLIIGFYLLYLLLWLWEIVRCLFNHRRGMYRATEKLNVFKRAYYSIAFEREAFRHEREKDYLAIRKHYVWASL
jgi:hypothetical protein